MGLERVSRWLFANSRSLHSLSFVFTLPNVPAVHSGLHQGLLWHSSRRELHLFLFTLYLILIYLFTFDNMSIRVIIFHCVY